MWIIFKKHLNENDKLCRELTKIHGIGWRQSVKACKKLGYSFNTLVKNLNNQQRHTIVNYLKKNLNLETFLRKEKNKNINNYIKNKSLRGYRLKNKLPVRGQRTHTNARTRKKNIR